MSRNKAPSGEDQETKTMEVSVSLLVRPTILNTIALCNNEFYFEIRLTFFTCNFKNKIFQNH